MYKSHQKDNFAILQFNHSVNEKGNETENVRHHSRCHDLITLISGIILEATGCSTTLVYFHSVIASLMFILIRWHLYLHFLRRNCMKLLAAQRSPAIKWLALFCVLTLISAVTALIHWLGSDVHSPIGGIHGKLGFVFIAFAIGHTIKRAKFFRLR